MSDDPRLTLKEAAAVMRATAAFVDALLRDIEAALSAAKEKAYDRA